VERGFGNKSSFSFKDTLVIVWLVRAISCSKAGVSSHAQEWQRALLKRSWEELHTEKRLLRYKNPHNNIL